MTVPNSVPTVPMGLDPFSRWFGRVFSAFGANLGIWTLQGLIYFGSTVVIVGVACGVLMLTVPGFLTIAAAAGHARHGAPPDINPAVFAGVFPIFLLVVIIACLLMGVLQAFFMAGSITTALKQQRGETIAVRDLFSAGAATWPLFGASILSYLLISISFLCCIVPGVFVAPLFLLTAVLIVDGKKGALESISESWKLVTQNYFLFFLYVLVFGALSFAVKLILAFIPGVNSVAPLVTAMFGTTFLALIMVIPYTEIFPRTGLTNFQSTYLPPAYTPPTPQDPPTYKYPPDGQ